MTVVLKDWALLFHGFATRMKFNFCTIIFNNILRQLDQKKSRQVALPSPCLIVDFILGCKDLSLPSDSWFRELDVMVMHKLLGSGIAPPSLTHSMLRASSWKEEVAWHPI